MSEPTGIMTTTINLFASPTEAFNTIKHQGRAWWPLLITIIISMATLYLYFDTVNFDWYVEDQVARMGDDLSPAQVETTRAAIEEQGKGVIGGISVVSVVIATPIIFLIYAVYLLIVSNIRNDMLVFGQCFSLIAWTNLVTIFSLIVGMLAISFAGDGNIPIEIHRGLSLNYLVFNFETSHPWYGWLSALDLTAIWQMVLLAIGYRTLTNASMTASAIIAAIPNVLIYAIWAAVI